MGGEITKVQKEQELTIGLLLVEDDDGDALLLGEMMADAEARRSGLHVTIKRAGRLSEAVACAAAEPLDICLLDLGLPDSLGIKTIVDFKALAPRLPVIVLTGLDDEQSAMDALQSGAQDYLVKGKITTDSVLRAVRYAIERHKLLQQLERSLHEIKILRGFLPICASCKKIKNDAGYWTQLEEYISNHSEAEFSHGICPECAVKVYGKYYKPENFEKR